MIVAFGPMCFWAAREQGETAIKNLLPKKQSTNEKKPFPKIPLQKSPVGFVQNQSLVNYLLYLKKKVNHKG